MRSADDPSDVEIVEEVALNLEAALELARAADGAGQSLGDDVPDRLAAIHGRLLRDGFRGRPEGALF